MDIKNYKNIDLQYFGSVNYFLDLVNSKYIYFNNALLHSKGLQVNRTSIMGANKVLVLSVPLEGGRAVKMNIKDLKIASRESWQRIHWRSIHDSYRKAPWFEEYAPWLEKLYGQSYTYLWDLNVKIMEWILQALKWNAVILAENEILNAFSLSKKNDNPGWVGKDGFPEYQQVFSNRLGFQPDLSVLDLILNEGPSAAQYLQKLSDYAVRISGKDPV